MEFIERRFINVENLQLRKLPEGKMGSCGMAATYSTRSTNLGGFYEMLGPGCFDDVLRSDQMTSDRDTKELWNHNADMPLARTANGSLRLESRAPKGSDKGGLWHESDFLDTQDARDAATKIGAGLVDRMSFAFTVPKDGDSWNIDDQGDVQRMVNKVGRLADVSPVTYPAYDGTSVGARSAVPNEVLGILVRCEHSLPVSRTDLEVIRDYHSRFSKILELDAPDEPVSLVHFQQRARLLGLSGFAGTECNDCRSFLVGGEIADGYCMGCKDHRDSKSKSA